jgi:hypothetical protein
MRHITVVNEMDNKAMGGRRSGWFDVVRITIDIKGGGAEVQGRRRSALGTHNGF